MAGRGNPANLTNAGKGRVPGTPNKTTLIAKEAIAKAFEGLGGVDRLIAWAREAPENERVFWGTIYPKLLPLQVTGEGGGPVRHAVLDMRGAPEETVRWIASQGERDSETAH